MTKNASTTPDGAQVGLDQPEISLAAKCSMQLMDSVTQSLEDEISAISTAIIALLKQSDTGDGRDNIRRLCNLMKGRASEAMNTINAEAEEWGANWIDERDRAESRAVREAANALEGGAA